MGFANVAGSSSGRTSPFEGEYPGSNPGPAVSAEKLNFEGFSGRISEIPN